MSILFLSNSSIKACFANPKALGLALGFAATVMPLIFIWSYLGSHYAGADGKLYQTLIAAYLKFGQWPQLVTHNPLQGAWNVGLPFNVWLNPALIPFSFLAPENAKPLSGAICYICYAASFYFLLRCFGVAWLPSIMISQFAFFAFEPFYYVFGTPTNFALRPWIAIIIALAFLAIGLVVKIENLTAGTIIKNAVAIAIIIIYAIALDPIWTLLVIAIFPVPFALIVFERGLSEATLARCLVLIFAALLIYVLGPGKFLLTLAANTSRYLEPALNARAQVPEFVSVIFLWLPTKYSYAAILTGWLLGLIFARGRVRLLVLIAVIAFMNWLVCSAIFLFVGVQWILPIPFYFETIFSGLYVMGAGAGYAAAISVLLRKVATFLKASVQPRWMSMAHASGVVLCLSVVPGYLAYTYAHAERLKILYEPWSPDHKLTSFLADELSLERDPVFRGSVTNTLEDYRGTLTQDSLWRRYVPTLNEYSQLVTQQSFVLVRQFQGNTGGSSNRLPLSAQNTDKWAKSYIKVTGALGTKFVISRKALPNLAAAIEAEGTEREELRFPGWKQDLWHVYELPATNTGNYSPTILVKAATAAEMVEAMLSSTFDFRRQAVLTTDLNERLVPLKEAVISFHRGAIRIKAASDATSLALLPVQFSHCLRISDPKARLLRVNLAMIGVLFTRDLDAEITDNFGLFTPYCRSIDVADIRRLKMEATIPRGTRPGLHPTAIRKLADVVPNVTKVLKKAR